MTEQPLDTTTLVPAPTPAPAEQQLSGDDILDFDPQHAVAVTVATVEVATAEVAIVEAPRPSLPDNLVDAVCPSCGTTGGVDFARRESSGFCLTCDFPLFWSRDRIVLPSNGSQDESGLRRLPGTAGRATLASLLCPVCSEPNPATGVTCVRCGSALHPVAVEPVLALPEPEPEPEVVEPHRSWWPYIIAAAAALVALVAVLVILYR